MKWYIIDILFYANAWLENTQGNQMVPLSPLLGWGPPFALRAKGDLIHRKAR